MDKLSAVPPFPERKNFRVAALVVAACLFVLIVTAIIAVITAIYHGDLRPRPMMLVHYRFLLFAVGHWASRSGFMPRWLGVLKEWSRSDHRE